MERSIKNPMSYSTLEEEEQWRNLPLEERVRVQVNYLIKRKPDGWFGHTFETLSEEHQKTLIENFRKTEEESGIPPLYALRHLDYIDDIVKGNVPFF